MRLQALVMAGGRGERFGEGEKPMALYRGCPLVRHVIASLEGAGKIGEISVVTSPWARKTEEYLKKKKWRILRAPGRGYVGDLIYALRTMDLGPTLTAAADLPLIRPEDVDAVVREYSGQREPALAVMVPKSLLLDMGLTPTIVYGDLVPAGINIVDGRDLHGPQRTIVMNNPRLAVNVNTRKDLQWLHRKAFK